MDDFATTISSIHRAPDTGSLSPRSRRWEGTGTDSPTSLDRVPKRVPLRLGSPLTWGNHHAIPMLTPSPIAREQLPHTCPAAFPARSSWTASWPCHTAMFHDPLFCEWKPGRAQSRRESSDSPRKTTSDVLLDRHKHSLPPYATEAYRSPSLLTSNQCDPDRPDAQRRCGPAVLRTGATVALNNYETRIASDGRRVN
jgi:hypothetical protein